MKGFLLRDEAGLTLVEILVAVAIIMVGLVAVMQWFPIGTQGMDTGRKQSTAVFLAEQQIEQIKSFALSTAANQGWVSLPANCSPCAAAAPFNSQGFDTIAGYPEYSIRVNLQAGPTTTTRLVQVQVSYRRITGGVAGAGGAAQRLQAAGTQVDMATLIAQH